MKVMFEVCKIPWRKFKKVFSPQPCSSFFTLSAGHLVGLLHSTSLYSFDQGFIGDLSKEESVRSLSVTKFGELIWTALQIENWCHHSKSFLETVLGFDVPPSGVRSLLGVWKFWKSHGNQIWRANSESSPNLESWIGQLSKLKPGIISNKTLDNLGPRSGDPLDSTWDRFISKGEKSETPRNLPKRPQPGANMIWSFHKVCCWV